jgi:hypothetical protein
VLDEVILLLCHGSSAGSRCKPDANGWPLERSSTGRVGAPSRQSGRILMFLNQKTLP